MCIRDSLRSAMEDQKADQKIDELGNNVINAKNNNKITGAPNTTDPYTGRTGYQIYLSLIHILFTWSTSFNIRVEACSNISYGIFTHSADIKSVVFIHLSATV